MSLASAPPDPDPKALLLARVVGEPSAELLDVVSGPCREAAVLIGLIDRADDVTVLLTQRAAHLPHHAGQISFPGGQLTGGNEDATTAALREAHEEVGLAPTDVDVLGRLGAQLTGTGFVITPIVGWIGVDFVARPDPAEVESVFEVPLEHLVTDEHRHRGTRERWGTRFAYDEFRYGERRIWGATAALLSRFIETIK